MSCSTLFIYLWPDLLVANTVTFEPLMETVSVALTALAEDVKESTEEFKLRLSLSPTAESLGLELGDPSLTTIIIPGTNESMLIHYPFLSLLS